MLIDRNLSKYIVFAEDSIFNALKKISDNKSRIIFSVTESGVLEGIVTDGDFRRWLVKQETIDLNQSVASISNKKFKYALFEDDPEKILSCFSEQIEFIPLLDRNQHLVAIAFDLIVPNDGRQDPSFLRIARHEQVFWHSGISDLQLRDIYQQASMLVLPLIDCTANNALIEAIACGLPVISNQVGGLPDYTRDSFADLFPVGDVEGMTQAILKLADDLQEREKRSQAARLFAQENLGWDKIAAQTLEIYHKVMKN